MLDDETLEKRLPEIYSRLTRMSAPQDTIDKMGCE
jgi:hypothetical protein